MCGVIRSKDIDFERNKKLKKPRIIDDKIIGEKLAKRRQRKRGSLEGSG